MSIPLSRLDDDLKSTTPSKKVIVRKPITRNNTTNKIGNSERISVNNIQTTLSEMNLTSLKPKTIVNDQSKFQQNNIVPFNKSEQQSKDSFKQPNFVKHEFEDREVS